MNGNAISLGIISLTMTKKILKKNKQLEICVHHLLTNTRNHLSLGIYAIYTSTFHSIMKNQIWGVSRVRTVCLKLGVFSEFMKLNILVALLLSW